MIASAYIMIDRIYTIYMTFALRNPSMTIGAYSLWTLGVWYYIPIVLVYTVDGKQYIDTIRDE